MLPESERAQLREEGYAYVDLGFDRATLDRAREAIEAIWAARRAAVDEGDTAEAEFTRARPELPRLHLESDVLASFCRSAPFVALSRALVGPDADMVWNQAHVKAPGGIARTRLPWHQDGFYAEFENPVAFSCWVALTPATVQNGAMWGARLPGRPMLPHVWDAYLQYFTCEIDEATAFPLELEMGQALVFDARFPHRSGSNGTDAARLAYTLSFAAEGARLLSTGETFGDGFAIVRGGRSAGDVLRESAQGEVSGEGARLLGSLRARLGRDPAEVDALFDRYAGSLRGDDAAASERLANCLLSLSNDSAFLNGDLIRARTHAPRVFEEAVDTHRHGNVEGANLLLRRAVQLDPSFEPAARALPWYQPAGRDGGDPPYPRPSRSRWGRPPYPGPAGRE